MENQNYQDELEELLQDEIKDHRMYPSDYIWRNIQKEVNGHQSWPALSFISLFIISALTVSTLLNNHPNQKLENLSNAKQLDDQNKLSTTTIKPHNIDLKAINPSELTAKTISEIDLSSQQHESTQATELIASSATPMEIATKEPIILVMPSKEIAARTNKVFLQGTASTVIPITKNQPTLFTEEKSGSLIDHKDAITENSSTINTSALIATDQTIANNHLENIPETQKTVIAPTDEFLKDFAYNSPIHIVKAKNSKFGFGFFVTPSTSYRKLTDERAKELLGAAPIAAPAAINYTTGINNIVRHKPAVGLELGFAVLYNMTNRLKFKTGFQFNIRQYYIETFQTSTDITTISLVNSRGIENISVFSPYNNTTGYRSTQLDNKMYQVSIPLGLQYDVIQGRKFGITAEASIQPTFTLNKSLYLLSTDYKHYADGNSLMRKWNINSAFGVNITYKMGTYQWYLGPQARFQHLPTYSNQYPITEYLMDYGIRLGFIKQLK
jgi:hypothetical protein